MHLSLKPPERLLESLISLGKQKKKKIVALLKERNKNGHFSCKAFKICDCERTKKTSPYSCLPTKSLPSAPSGSGDTGFQAELNPSAAQYQPVT